MTRQINIGVITRYTEANYHGTLLYGIHQWARSHNVNLFVINTYMINRFYSNSQKIDVFYHTAFKHIDGWIILTEGANPEYISALDKSEKPVVLVGFNREDYKYTIIKDDGKFGAKTVVEHLIIHGHKRIGFIGWMELDDMRERFKGYKETLEEHNIALDPNLVYITGNAIPKDGKEAVRYWLKNNIDFSAVFAANDGIAIGVIEALKEAGFRLPKDIAVIGYDNSSLAKNINPSLSSMNQNILEIGMGAAEALIDEINKNSYSGRTIFIKSSLVCRRSCGCKYDYEDNSELSRDNINLKDTMIRCLEDAIYKNSDVGAKLLTTSIDEIKKLFPQIVDNYSWECIGFWDEDCNGKSSLNIKRVYNSYTKKDYNPDVSCTIENFPPVEFMPDLNKLNAEDVIWILPISSTTRNWGILSYISPFNKAATLFAYNISIILFTLLGIAMDRDVATTELEKALETLKQTQEKLIQSEKMGSLAGLVAGVAHEINTPVGVSVTAASFLEEKTNEVIELFRTGKLKKAELEKYINATSETIKILIMNLNRASNLIKSFKQIAADQSNEEKRNLIIYEYINEVLLSLTPKLKKTKHKIVVNCPEDIKIYTSPGGLSQIITNLVVNSLTHAFDDEIEGVMTINVTREDNEIIFEYTDNGKGINESDIKKIFDPFFTTKRGKGGTGLGLNIVYNIITQEYKGSIKCKSSPGKGVTFMIRIPEREVNGCYVK